MDYKEKSIKNVQKGDLVKMVYSLLGRSKMGGYGD
jgi:hypothetical protein